MINLNIGDKVFCHNYGIRYEHVVVGENIRSYILDNGISVNKKNLSRQKDGFTVRYFTEESFERYTVRRGKIHKIRKLFQSTDLDEVSEDDLDKLLSILR